MRIYVGGSGRYVYTGKRSIGKTYAFEVMIDSKWNYFGLKEDGKLSYETRDWKGVKKQNYAIFYASDN